MTPTLEAHLVKHSALLPESTPLKDGTRVFPLKLPCFVEGREIGEVWLRLSPGFPQSRVAEIWLEKSKIFRIPHVEDKGKLCIEGDPGPTSGAAPEARIDQLITQFHSQFCDPWNQGELDGHFRDEALNYWALHCSQKSSTKNPIKRILVLENRPSHPRMGDGVFLPDKQWVLFGENSSLMEKTLMGIGVDQRREKVIVAELPISTPLTPDTWPRTIHDLEQIVLFRFPAHMASRFLFARAPRNRRIHRLLILRAPTCDFGFLLTGGPTKPVRRGHSWGVYYVDKPIPLHVERLDISWICGRDQHPNVLERQKKRVLVIGVGALGSHVVEHLVKAGIGYLTLVDSDHLSAANLGRHVLGIEDFGMAKASALAARLNSSWPSVEITAFQNSLRSWLTQRTLKDFDLVLDLTGEPEVRLQLEVARKKSPSPLLIGWMEPFVAAAHVCLLPSGERWSQDLRDPLEKYYAIEWPDDVLLREPACSSTFQSYTHSAASHAVALVAEAAINLLDGDVSAPIIRSMVRGRRFLDVMRLGLEYRPWATKAAPFDAVTWERLWNA